MTDAAATIIEAPVRAHLSWRYESRDPRLVRLYDKAKTAQWDARTDIDWSPDIEFGGPLRDLPEGSLFLRGLDSSPVPAELHDRFRWEFHAWMTSQFLHGEQGALLSTARLVETLPDMDAKLYAASQVNDEARHVEAFTRYEQRLGASYPINSSLRNLLGNLISDQRWDIIFLGNQIIVEGLALAAFRLRHASAFDPVIKQITELVARDESRHVAFGVMAIDGLYDEMTAAERAEREEFINEAALLMSRRFRLDEVWERMELDVAAGVAYTLHDPVMVDFRRLLFVKIVAELRKLGLLTPRVREHLAQLGLMRTPAPA